MSEAFGKRRVPDAGGEAAAAPSSSGNDVAMMTIGEVAKRTNITPRALRLYENDGLITSYRLGSWRYYDASIIARLGKILRLKACDFTLQQIKDILENSDAVGDAELALPRALIEDQIERLMSVRSRVDRAISDLSGMMPRS